MRRCVKAYKRPKGTRYRAFSYLFGDRGRRCSEETRYRLVHRIFVAEAVDSVLKPGAGFGMSQGRAEVSAMKEEGGERREPFMVQDAC